MFKENFRKTFAKIAVVGLVFGLLLWFFVWRITYFNFPIYDETYYVEAAQALYKGELDTNKVHPPVAKWLISLPMYYLGDSWSLAWRVSPLVFGFSGLILLYFFALRIGLKWWEGLLVVLLLVGSKSWYILSRVAMLDIFLCFFVLLAGYFLFRFMVEKNTFASEYSKYTDWKYYWLFCVVTGIAGATKWSGFFPFLFFVIPFWWFYVQCDKWLKIRIILVSGLVVGAIFSLTSIAALQFRFDEFLERNGFSIVTHNSSMLPEFNPDEHKARGGFDAFWRFFVFDEGYLLKVDGYALGEFSNNHVVALTYLVTTLLFFMIGLGRLLRALQRIEFTFPGWFKDKTILYLYFFAASLMLPWALIPRNQYIYYFVPAFPFILLMATYALYSYFDKKIMCFYLSIYFFYFFYHFRLIIPY